MKFIVNASILLALMANPTFADVDVSHRLDVCALSICQQYIPQSINLHN